MAQVVINITGHSETTCRSFFDVDLGYGGIEIYEDGERLGSMIDVNLPDENDEEEMEWFENKVENWLIDNGH